MSKLPIILCVLFCASAVHCSIVSMAFDNVKRLVETPIAATISQVKDKSEIAQNKAQELAKTLLEEATKLGRKIHTEIKNDLLKTEDDVNELANKAKGIDVSECTEQVARLDRTALAVISNTSACITDKLETGSGYIESIIKVSNDQLANLTSLREELHQCRPEISASPISCAHAVGLKVAWVSAQGFPKMITKITELSFKLGALNPSLVYCSASHGLVTFHQESSSVADKAKKCIQEKIDNAPSATTSTINH